MQRYIFNPFSVLMIFFLIMSLVLLLPLLFFSLIGTAFTKLGFSPFAALGILVATIIGSFINIPVKETECDTVRIDSSFCQGMFCRMYRIPEYSTTTTISVNVGGALIPVCISLYLIVMYTHTYGTVGLFSVFVGLLLVSVVVGLFAKPVPGFGIVTPLLIPPFAALLCGLILGGGFGIGAAIIAYVSGTLGTLIGADLFNLNKIQGLGAPVISIGGAGTFDGIFLTGIIAALLA